MKKLEHLLEMTLFNSRWLLVPFFIGLSLSILLLMFKFIAELAHMTTEIMTTSASSLVIEILHLIDLSLIASLLIIILLSGYESFVSRIDLDGHEDKPSWMGKIGFSELKLKVIGSIVAISAIDLLTVFLNMSEFSEKDLFWKVAIHLTFVVSGLLFALMDKISHSSSH
ncbi:MAG: TIGR00645 family protein [Cocleimonas sp.]|nr:TIGR00645 family protein [Cocleimonas sp.]